MAVNESVPHSIADGIALQVRLAHPGRRHVRPVSAIGGGVNSTVPRKALGGRSAVRIKDKADRATVEGVLDPRTMLILFKMVNRACSRASMVLSTGKRGQRVPRDHASRGDEQAAGVWR